VRPIRRLVGGATATAEATGATAELGIIFALSLYSFKSMFSLQL